MNYKKTIEIFLSSDEKTPIKYALYLPEKQIPKAVLQISPDMGELFEYYERFCDMITAHGIIVCICDCIENINALQNNENEYPEKYNTDIIMEDIQLLHSAVRKRYRSLPCFILGCGTGALATRLYALKYPSETDGIILNNVFNGYSSLDMLICKAIAVVSGKRRKSEFLKKTVFKKYKFSQAFTCNEYITFLNLLKETSTDEWAASYPKSVPMLIINAESSQGSYKHENNAQLLCDMLTDAEFEPLSLKNYHEFSRDIFNESDSKLSDLCDDIVMWLDRIVADVIELRNSSAITFSKFIR